MLTVQVFTMEVRAMNIQATAKPSPRPTSGALPSMSYVVCQKYLLRPISPTRPHRYSYSHPPRVSLPGWNPGFRSPPGYS